MKKTGLPLVVLGALLAALLPLLLLSPAPVAAAPPFVVNSAADEPDDDPGDGVCDSGGGICTLRAAVMEANALAGQDTISLQPNTTYLLDRLGTGDANGGLRIHSDIVLNGAGAGSSVIDGNGRALTVTVVTVAMTGTAVISGVTIRNGFRTTGGGISNFGRLVLRNSAVVSNTADSEFGTNGYGGGIYNFGGELTVDSSQILSNASRTVAGGLYNGDGHVTIVNSTISANTVTNYGSGGILNDGVLTLTGSTVSRNIATDGAGIVNVGTLLLVNSTLSSNFGRVAYGGYGGGIYNRGGLTVDASQIMSNTNDNAGGLYNDAGPATIVNSTVSGNTTIVRGGGILNGGALTLTGSTISRNTAANGGGLGNYGALVLVNSTLSGNRTYYDGGGLWNSITGTVTLYNATIAHNDADLNDAGGTGGGIYNAGGPFNFRNSLVANNRNLNGVVSPVSDDCDGTLTSADYNLIEDTGGCSLLGPTGNNKIGMDPQLGPLQNNGGPSTGSGQGATWTHALLPGSPAIDAGRPSGCTGLLGALLTTDQRGLARAVDGNPGGGARCDMGAFEYLLPMFLPVIRR